MARISDIPATPEARAKFIDRTLSDPSRCVVLGNQFDNFDYAAAKQGVVEFVDSNYTRITGIVSEMTGPQNGHSSATA